MQQAFLFGDVAHNFAETSAPFVAAAGGRSARIALLLQGGEGTERFVPGYREPWLRLGATEVVPIWPADGEQLPPGTLDELRRSTAIFIGGGDTRRYHRLYADSEVGAVIRERYAAGVPFGGVSAGALIAPRQCTLWGAKVTGETNSYYVRPRELEDLYEDGDTELQLADGLGLLEDLIVDVHLAETGSLPRLIAATERSGVGCGLGIDEPICAEIRGGKAGRIYGQGRAYLLRRLGAQGRFELEVLEPGSTFEL